MPHPRPRILNGIARNCSHQFASSAEHFAYMAAVNNTRVIQIDLLAGSICQEEFRIARNLNLVTICQETLLRNLAPFKYLGIESAILVVDFTPVYYSSISIERAIFTTTLSDKRQRKWVGKYQSNFPLPLSGISLWA
jgi:hypothetical protein